MSVKSKMENSPVISSLTIVAITAAALTGFGTITGTYDRAHINELELAESHPVQIQQFEELESKIDNTDILSRCRWLKSEIRALEDSIYVRRRDNGDADYIHSLELDLDDLKEKYRDLSCIRRLS